MAVDSFIARLIIVRSYHKSIISSMILCALHIANCITRIVAACADNDWNFCTMFFIPFFYQRNDDVNHLCFFIFIERRSLAACTKRKQTVYSAFKLKKDILFKTLIVNGTIRKHRCNHCR